MNQERHTSIERALLGFSFASIVLALGGCGGDNAPGSAPKERPAAESVVEADDGSKAGEADDGRFGIGLETTAELIADQLENASGYAIDGTTITVDVSDGSVDFDGMIDCLSVSGLLNDGESLEITYPDGTKIC